ncbi:ABC transporter ATP-binding protein [Aureimonas leprariae]|uniref:ABC transporter ATP-binding protein n=2 Tax=Plantimonas leprariae TaxID=2615207 RepID=A0A7V7PM38_9HYPH|nr:ABC transporter ATP-binding protein [Aureimonas leprariae]
MTKAFPPAPTRADPPNTVPRLRITGLRKRLGNTDAVAGIDLDVAAGESVVLLGPSGCGKSTTLRLIAGFLQPDRGEIALDGASVATDGWQLPPERRHLGMVFQNYAVWPHKTVFENVAYGLRIAKRPGREIASRVERMLETVELGGMGGRRPSELSGGQQQRVALARSLVTEPTLLLLDEPLSNLDAALRQTMRFELKSLQRRLGVSTLYVTHDQEEALVLADRIVVMNAGGIEQVGTPEDIYRRPASRFVASFVGSANILEGTVTAVLPQQDRARIRLDAGPEFDAAIAPGALASIGVGDRRAAVLRPEEIELVHAGPPAGIAVIEAAHFLGNRYETRLVANGVAVRAEARTPPVGETATLTVADGAGWIIA